MERVLLVLFTLLLPDAAAAAGFGPDTIAHHRGDVSTALRAFPAWRGGGYERGGMSARFIPVADSAVEFELALWRIVRESKNPADYEAYLDVFPNGRFAKQARETLARLSRKESGARAGKERRIRPAPAETIEKVGQTYTVRVTANLRQGPSVNFPVIGRAKKGQQLFVLGKTVGRNWYKVSTATGRVAYIAGNLIEERGVGVRAPSIAPRETTPPKGQARTTRDDKSEYQPAETKADVPRSDVPSPPLSVMGKETAPAPTRQESSRESPARKSLEEIERYWIRRIGEIKESGPHGDCRLYVGDPFADPPEFDLCEDRNERIGSLRRQMERELTEHR